MRVHATVRHFSKEDLVYCYWLMAKAVAGFLLAVHGERHESDPCVCTCSTHWLQKSYRLQRSLWTQLHATDVCERALRTL